MNVLIIGSGGREHALAWKIKQSPLLRDLYAIPGSSGMRDLAECPKVAPEDFEAVADFCSDRHIDLVVVGPEAPLAKGIADRLAARGIKVFGPTGRGAMLEASKQFAKEFMERHGIPTAAFKVLYTPEFAREQVRGNKNYPVVIKADGLSAGKGVRICRNEAEALLAVEDFMEKRVHGFSGSKVVMEDFLTGREASVMALTDGESYVMLPVSRDYKRLKDNDEGPNTGGMGALCPAEVSASDMEVIRKEVLERFVEGIKKEKISFRGVIYAGLMFSPQGPKVLEFNVRFGDPETQAVMPLLNCDLLPLLAACADGKLAGGEVKVTAETCVAVVLASAGYPENPEKGREIEGLEAAAHDVAVFHSGAVKGPEKHLTSGGRVLTIAACAGSAEGAREKVYGEIGKISFAGMQYRKDIGN